MHALILINGPADDLPAKRQIPTADVVIAADGGASHARRLGLSVSTIIGDMDSIGEQELASCQQSGTERVTYLPDKDATDLELAIQYAVEHGAERITLVGMFGGRPDQSLANILLLTRPILNGISVQLLGHGWQGYCIRDGVSLAGQPGDIVSLIPLTPEVTGVTTSGLVWQLQDATLHFGSTLSVSNSMAASRAQVSLTAGILLVIHLISTHG